MPKFYSNVDINNQKITNSRQPVSPTDGVNKEYVDSKTADIYTSVTDDFKDSTKISINNGVVVDVVNGYVRPQIAGYSDDFSSKTFIDEDLTNTEVDVISGVAKVTSTTVGFQNGELITHALTSETHSFIDNVTHLRVTADINDNVANLTGLSSVQKTVNQPLSYSWSLTYQHKGTSDNDIYEVFFAQNTTSLLVYKNNTQYSFTKPQYTYTESDTLVKNVKIISDVDTIFVSYPTGVASYEIKRIRKSDMTLLGTLSFTEGVTCQKMDMAIINNGLYVVVASTTSTVYTLRMNTTSYSPSSFTTAFPQPFSTLINNTATGVMVSVFLNSNGSFGAFLNRASSSVWLGFNITSTPVVKNVTETTLESCNGNGTSVTNGTTTYAIFARNGGLGLTIISYVSGGTTLTYTTNIAFTIGSFGTSSTGTRFMDAELQNTADIHIIFPTFSRNNVSYALINPTIASPIKTFITNLYPTVVFSNTPQLKMVKTSTEPFLYRLYVNNNYFEYRNDIKPTIFASIRNNANAALGPLSALTSSENSAVFTIAATQNVRVRFDFRYPIFTECFSGTVYSVDLNSYTLEQVTPTPTFSETTTSFESIALVTDRVIRSVSLNVDQDVGSLSGSNILWQVSSLNNVWHTINGSTTPAWTVEFPEGQYGSQLKVKATITKGSGTTTLATIPKIFSYTASVKNIVLQSEIVPLQINLMKLGLQVGAWNASQRTGFTKMMIDTFTTTDGVFSTDVGVSHNNTTKLYSGTGTVISNFEETDNNIFPTQILVVDDISSSPSSNIVYKVKRNEGNWETVVPNTIHIFQYGTSQTINKIQIQATLTGGANLAGWAYLYS